MIIFAPKRFGKSMNVSMVKRFFEIEGGRDVINAPQDLKELEKFENFRAFNRYEMKRPCKILAEEDFVKEHFGRHPVLHLVFKNVDVTSIQHVEYHVKEIIHEAYLAHSYLENGKIFSDPSDNEDANKLCRIWCDPEKYETKQPIGGLEQLIEYLHAYHKRKVYLLVDEFDAPAVKALLANKSGDEVHNISSQVTNLLGAVVKGEVGTEHLLGSLITGVSYLGSVGISEDLNNIHVYKWLLDDEGRFAPYYGLGQNELETLLEHVFPNEDEKRSKILGEVKNLYNGYNFKNEPLYCLWSVLHYIQIRSTLDASEMTEKLFWGGSSIISRMGSLLRNSGFMDEIIKIMNVADGGYISFSPCKKVDAQVLANFLNKNEPIPRMDIIFSFFLEQGYLTRAQRNNVPAPDTKNAIICVKIPNVDVLLAFEEMFKNFCATICGLCEFEMGKCANVFKNLPKDRDDEIFKEKLGDFYNHLRRLLQRFNGQEGINERSLQAALYTTMLKAEFTECCMEKYVYDGSKFGKIDIWWLIGSFANICELKLDKSNNHDSCKKAARNALKEIIFGSEGENVPYVKILKEYPDTKNYVLMGICMSSQGTLYMCCLVNSVNIKDCITFSEDD